MARTVPTLPPAQLAALQRSYVQSGRERRGRSLGMLGTLVVLVGLASIGAEVNIPKFFEGLPRFGSYFIDITPHIRPASAIEDIGEWYWAWDKWLLLLAETLVVAYVGTALGAIGAFAGCFVASRNINANRWTQIAVRRVLEFLRTVPDIVFALLFVYALGLGPMPGVIAIALHTCGALGKQFSEVVENIDRGPIDGIVATGGDWFQMVRFAVIPQVLSNFVSYALLRFEINVRGASVMGFVGAGGIGKELLSSIRQFYYTDVSAILLMIIATVALIDIGTEWLRHRLLGRVQ